MKSLSIRNKVLIMVVGMALFLAVQTLIMMSQTSSVEKNLLHYEAVEEPVQHIAFQLKMSVVQVQQWLTDISATRGLDGLNDGFDEAERHANNFRSLNARLGELLPAQRGELNAMLAVFEAYYATGKSMAQAYVAEGPVAGNLMMGKFDAAAASLAGRVEPFVAQAQENAQLLLADISVNSHQNLLMVYLFSGIYLLVLGLLYWGASSGIIRPIRRVSEMAHDLAEGDGDLTQRLAADRKTELGELCHWFNEFIAKTQNTISEVGHKSKQLASAAQELAALSEQTSQGMSQQHSQTDSIKEAMEQVNITVAEVAKSAQSADSAARSAHDESEQGARVICNTIEAIHTMAERVESASQTIMELNSHSQDIGEVMQVIESIAEQTNLLALNAAIEAARAGEQGRGFAVVADEVRTLAQRTKDSTGDIHIRMSKLRDGTKEAVAIMQESSDAAKQTIERAAQGEVSLRAITEAVVAITGLNTQIAAASEEQSAVVNEVNGSVVDISRISTEVTYGSNNVAVKSEELVAMASDLKDQVNRFRV